MFRPSASSTYSSAKSAMRTQKLPADCSSSGSTSSATAATAVMASLFCLSFTCCSSGPVGHALAQEARWPQGEDDDEHDEGEDVGVVPAQPPPRGHADVARADGLDQPQQEAAHHRATQVADAAEHRGRERL